MTPNEKTLNDSLKALNKSVKHLQKITDALWCRHLENKAWIIAMREKIEDLLAKEPKQTLNAVTAGMKKRQKDVLQTLLERVENRSPQIAAEIDRRNIGDVLGDE
jgi:hypothetical protein